jgi:SAM-dependent methyltransferase
MDKTILTRTVLTTYRTDPPDGWVYKEQPKTMVDNEAECYKRLKDTGYVPRFERLGSDLMRVEDLGPPQPVTDPARYLYHAPLLLSALRGAKIRHGDLTEYSVIPIRNWPMLIDFGESRHINDPRPDKRREGDRHWLVQTMRKQAVHNQRAPEIWEIIGNTNTLFRDKTVLDLGCGYGDMVLYAANAGAAHVRGIDNDESIVQAASERAATLRDSVSINHADIDELMLQVGDKAPTFVFYDIAFCFSVLPYLKDAPAALAYLAKYAKVTFIEWQYTGDGPGNVSGIKEMRQILSRHWNSIKNIGHTLAKEEQVRRDIWMCQEAKS